MLNESETARRKPVWEALSWFWLDTELEERDWQQAARVFMASGYSPEEIAEIHVTEVAPVLWANSLPVPGVWDGFDLDWLSSEVLRRTRRRRWLFRLWRKLGIFDRYVRWFTGRHWRRVVEIMRSEPHP